MNLRIPTKQKIKNINGDRSDLKQTISGRLTLIGNSRELSTVEGGDIVVISSSAFSSDSLHITYACIEKGACALIFEKIGRTDHGLIAARELGMPAFIFSSVDKLINKKKYTISSGFLYKGELRKKESILQAPVVNYKIKHKLKINLGFPLTIKKNPNISNRTDGVAFSRLEFCLLSILKNEHPLSFINNNSVDKLANIIADNLEPILRAYKEKPVWFRTDDFASSQLKHMKGGAKIENDEVNEALGWRGIRRSLDQKDFTIAQFKAFSILVEKGYKNIGVFPPMTNNIKEYRSWLTMAKGTGLNRQKVAFGLMVETPAAALTIEDFVKDINFVVFGTNDLTQFTLAVDRTNTKLASRFDEKDPAVLYLINRVIKICNKHKIETYIGGQGGSDEKLLKYVFDMGITGTSVNPDNSTISRISKFLYKYEQSKKAKK